METNERKGHHFFEYLNFECMHWVCVQRSELKIGWTNSMQLNAKTLERLRGIINGDGTSDYRSGPQLVKFFNELGFNDAYAQGFPSRWYYTDEKLKQINGTPELDKCLKNTFAVVNYVSRITELDALISEFNRYMAFDKWAILRDNDSITFKKLDKVIVDAGQSNTAEIKEDEFLKQAFITDIDSLGLDAYVSEIIKIRLKEVENCINNESSLASILLIGSILEGILLGTALMHPQKYNQSQSAPKNKEDDRIKRFPEWSLSNLIDASFDIGILKQDVKKFSHVVRDFRNYIHPYEQMSSLFIPDKHTALICLQVLKAAISQIGIFHKNTKGAALNDKTPF